MRSTNHAGQLVRTRRVAEIIALDPGERETGYATTHVFAADPQGLDGPGGTAMPAVLPDAYRSLTAHGFDLGGYLAQQQAAPGSTPGSPPGVRP